MVLVSIYRGPPASLLLFSHKGTSELPPATEIVDLVDVMGLIKLKRRGHCRTPYLHECWGTNMGTICKAETIQDEYSIHRSEPKGEK